MKKIYLLILLVFLTACSDGNEQQVLFDGRLETDIIKISAKTSGNLDSLFVDEGNVVTKNQLMAVVDSKRLRLQKRQQKAQLGEISANNNSIDAQIKQLRSQLTLNEGLVRKTKDLLQKGAATPQKLDELTTQSDILEAQLEALKAQQQALYNKREQLMAGIALTELNIEDSHLVSPIDGIVLNRYANFSELVNPGVPVFELADLTSMKATIYVSLKRLTDIKPGQPVKVLVDDVAETFDGKVQWIASEAEFTPKTILTEETRTSLVYAVKVGINNDKGKLKIGMPVRVGLDLEQ